MAEFKAGMKVRHRSGGGPVMIVERTGADHAGRPRVWCEWFDAADYRHNESFAPEVLEEVPAAPPATPESARFFGVQGP